MTHHRLCVTFICATLNQDPTPIHLLKKDCHFQFKDEHMDEWCRSASLAQRFIAGSFSSYSLLISSIIFASALLTSSADRISKLRILSGFNIFSTLLTPLLNPSPCMNSNCI